MLATHTRSDAGCGIRLRSVPPFDPPFEDETPRQLWSPVLTSAQLALDLPVARSRPARSTHGRGGVVVATSARGGTATARRAARAAAAGAALAMPVGPPADGLAMASPEAWQAARRFIGACLEIFNGYRPVSHVRRLSSPVDAAVITEQAAAGVARVAALRRPPGRSRELVQLRLLLVCEPCTGVAEAAAAVGAAGRTWAVAYRLERRKGNWLGTAAQVL